MAENLRAGVRMAQLQLYVSNHIHDRFLAPPLTLIVTGLLTSFVPVWQAGLWGIIELAIILNYISVYRRFQNAKPGVREERLWLRRISLAHGAHMLAWSSLLLWAWQPGNFSSLIFVMLAHIGLISLTVTMSNVHLDLLYRDLVFPVLSLIVPPLIESSWFNGGLCLLSIFYTLLMLRVGREINRSTTEALLLRERNETLIRELERQASRDALTGMLNRRYFLERAKQAIQEARQHQHSLALLMVDIDHFKPVNDHYGHLAGDEVIAAVAGVCTRSLRVGDCLGRLGGEEFSLVLPDVSEAEARDMAERLRAATAGLAVEVMGGTIRPTISIGVTMLQGRDQNISNLLHQADIAMYQSKATGRNRVTVYDPHIPSILPADVLSSLPA